MSYADVSPAVYNHVVMGDRGEACAECSRSCSSFHRTMHDPYPIVSSFFKVMFGNLFSEILFVPPRFAKTIIQLEGKNTYLEDPTGQKWKVHLSNVNGSLAFEKGWHDFSVDHGIELGDLVVFHYFKGSHFIVQIFGRSGCEKPMIYSGMDYQNKRAKLTRTDPCDLPHNKEPTPEKECLDSCMETEPNVDVHNVEKSPEIGVNVSREGNINKQPGEVFTADPLVESFFMGDRNTSYTSEDHRIDLYDLSIFEMPGHKADADKISMLMEYTCSEVPSALQQNQSEEVSPDVVNFQMAETINETSNEEDASRKECLPVLNNTVSGAEVPLDICMPLKSVTLPHAPEFSPPAAPVERVEPPCKDLMIYKPEPKSDKIICGLEAKIVSRDSEISVTIKGRRIKKEDISSLSTSMDKNKGRIDMIVKLEEPEFCDSPSARDIKITCLVQQDNESYLALPKPLPIKIRRQGDSLEQNLVLLRDPLKRLWPVIYHQRKGSEVLANGWKEFRNANCIHPGDECTFVVENIDEGIIQVQIVSQLAD